VGSHYSEDFKKDFGDHRVFTLIYAEKNLQQIGTLFNNSQIAIFFPSLVR
jgi:hypothetical protein